MKPGKRKRKVAQHRFVTKDGTGRCCSCGWLCAGGQRGTCRAEWEMHKAVKLLDRKGRK
jgi:hypothetical protein